jgi:hypothetical protein
MLIDSSPLTPALAIDSALRRSTKTLGGSVMSSLSPSSKLLTLIGMAIAVFPTQGEEFSWQLSGVTSRLEIGDFSSDSWAVDGTYYVNPIDEGAGPYGLAAFLDPTTRLSAATSRRHDDWRDGPNSYTLDGTYVLRGDKWYVGASYSKTDMEDWPLPVTRDDENRHGVLAGRYLGANTTLELGLGRSEQRFESSICPLGVPCTLALSVIPYAVETTEDSVGLDVFHVRRFRSLTYSLQGSVSQSEAQIDVTSPMPSLVPASPGDNGTVRAYSFAGELFPTDRLGLRIGYSRPDYEGPDGHGYDFTATWFFKPRVAVQFGLSRTTSASATLGDVDSSAIRLIGRL